MKEFWTMFLGALVGFGLRGLIEPSRRNQPQPVVTVWRDTTEHATCFLRDSGAMACLWDSERPAR